MFLDNLCNNTAAWSAKGGFVLQDVMKDMMGEKKQKEARPGGIQEMADKIQMMADEMGMDKSKLMDKIHMAMGGDMSEEGMEGDDMDCADEEGMEDKKDNGPKKAILVAMLKKKSKGEY